MSDGSIALRAISKQYPGSVASLSEVELTVAAGSFLSVVGPSGSGKSTLLRLIAGLETPTSGRVLLDDRPADDLPPWRRGVAMVFQEQPPYPHLDVFENLAFPLRASRLPLGEVRRRVHEVAETLGLDGLLDRRPAALSGGERRRVVLGRAVARRPRILLLDEPLTGLDAPLRASMRRLLSDLHRRFSMTMILVTHDQAEALAMGDRVAILYGGRVIQHGSPAEVYDRPETVEVARFIGEPPMNLLPAELAEDAAGLVVELRGRVRVALGARFRGDQGRPRRIGPVVLGLRPEHFRLGQEGDLGGTVREVECTGPHTIVGLDLGGESVRLRLSRREAVLVGDRIRVQPRLDLASWFDPATWRRIDWPARVQSDP